uniref:ankyrin repeat and SAM domain-containing protein 6-like n=1 Tax=Erigeron canadensis TaxID=72917 RepID=UPI001CB8B779|nr:ankyrin repeat and SAM domain-containing protein 6-like [Erigeron canadensis]
MLLSHMETKGQRWPNVRLGEIGDVSTAYNYGLPDMMMNNLWSVYDFNILQEPQNDHIYGFPEQGSSEFTVSDAALSSSRFLLDMEQSRGNDMDQNRENDDPNSIKDITNETEMVDSKVTQKSVKGPRSKRCKRTVFEGPWSFVSTPSMDVYESTDNQGSAMSKRTLVNEVSGPALKKQKGQSLENSDFGSEFVSLNSVGRWLEDVGFGRYADMFELHEVDTEALPLLTLDDLKEMGVLAVGPRRKLYAAISRLRGN